MSDGAITLEPPAAYEYPPRVSVVCPKCGHTSVFPFAGKHGNTIEYVGVCGAAYAPRLWCDAVINVHVSSHLFPA